MSETEGIAGFWRDAWLRLRRFRGRLRRWFSATRRRVLVTIAIAAFFLLAAPPFLVERIEQLRDCAFGAGCTAGAAWLNVALALVAAFFYVLAFLVIAAVVRKVVWSRMSVLAPRDSRCRVLITGLSALDDKELTRLDRIKTVFAGKGELYARPRDEYLAQTALGDPEALAGMAIRWQQNARSVAHFGQGLERVLVLPSEQSLAQWPAFAGFMAALFPRLPADLVRDDDGEAFKLPSMPGQPDRDYEDYGYVWTGLSLAVDRLQEESGKHRRELSDSDICIDVTGGTKTFSIAAANVTLNRELKLSYVSNEGEVKVYNAELATADSMTGALNTAGAGL